MPTERDVWLLYTDWKGETERRHVRPHLVRFGAASPWHTERQWLLDAFDLGRAGVARTFALSGIRAWAATAGGLPSPVDPALLDRLAERYAPPAPPTCSQCRKAMVERWRDGAGVCWHCAECRFGEVMTGAGDADVIRLIAWARRLVGGEDAPVT